MERTAVTSPTERLVVMLSALLVTLREGFEAALLIGIVLAFLHQTGTAGRTRGVWLGVAAAVGVSLVVGGTLFALGGELEGSAEALFEAGAMFAAVAVLTWMTFWMQRQARTLAGELRGKVSDALVVGGTALFWVACIMVVREGLETALFLFAGSAHSARWATDGGGLAGLAIAVALGYAVYRGGSRVGSKVFFRFTGVLLILFSAYLLSGAMHELGEVLGSEALEESGPLVAGAYGVGMLVVFFWPQRLTNQTSC
jgi:high-affinity iron transporter